MVSLFREQKKKALDAGYGVLSAAGKGILDARRQAVDKMKDSEKVGKPTHSFNSSAYFPEVNDGKEVDSAEQPVKDRKVEAELRRRENSANQKGGMGK